MKIHCQNVQPKVLTLYWNTDFEGKIRIYVDYTVGVVLSLDVWCGGT